MLRTVKFWVRVIPRNGKKPTKVPLGMYRTKRKAAAVKRRGEILMQVKGHYWQPPRRNDGQ